MLDWPLILWVKLPVVDRIHPQSNKIVMAIKNRATGTSKLNDHPEYYSNVVSLITDSLLLAPLH